MLLLSRVRCRPGARGSELPVNATNGLGGGAVKRGGLHHDPTEMAGVMSGDTGTRSKDRSFAGPRLEPCPRLWMVAESSDGWLVGGCPYGHRAYAGNTLFLDEEWMVRRWFG